MPRAVAYRRQIVADIIERINNGTYEPGARLPSDRELAEQYGCSVHPVKTAMDELSIRGYVVRHQGAPTRVADEPPVTRSGGG
jgi:DNA-binding GntR family transcriptional regulator